MRILVLILLLSLQGFSQFKITHYNSENGLPHDLCYQVIQDKDGYIWLGTDNGLVKFNGNNFQNFNRNQGLANNFVIDVFEGGSKKLVATWGGGVYYFDGMQFYPIGSKQQKFTKQQQIVQDDDGFIYSIENRSRLNIFNKKGELISFYSLIGEEGKKKWVIANFDYPFQVQKNGSIISFNLQINKKDDLIFCYTDKYTPQFKGVYLLNKNNRFKSVFQFLRPYYIIDIQKKNKNYIATTPDEIIEFNWNGIIKILPFHLKNKSIIQFTENNFFEAYILLDKKTNNHEILLKDKLTKEERYLNFKDLKSPVSDILIAKDNSVLISTYGNGLFIVQKTILPIYKNVLKSNFVFDYLETPNHNFFLATDNVIATDKEYNFFGKTVFKTVFSFSRAEKDKIFLKNKNNALVYQTIKSYKIVSTSDSHETKLFGVVVKYGDVKIHFFKNNKWQSAKWDLTSEEINVLKIKHLIDFKNNVYVISNLGVLVFNKDFKQINRYTQTNGLINDDVLKVLKLGGKLYFLNQQGFVVFDGKKTIKHAYVNGYNDFFNDFTINSTGEIWFATQKGLVLFKNEKFLLFTKNEGLSSSFYSKVYENSKKQLVGLGSNGIDVFSRYKGFSAKSYLQIVLSNDSKSIDENQKITIEPNENYSLKADVISFQKSPYQLQYQINNQDWKRLNGNSIDFSNYKSGNYNLKLRVKYSYSDWVYSPTYNLQKNPVWYLRWFVFVPSVIFFIVVVGVLIHLRILQLKKRNERLQYLLESNEKLQFQLDEMRHNIAQDFHDELGNKLAGISVLSEKLLNDKELRVNENYPVVERIYKDSQDLFQGIRDFIWAIDSKNGTLEELIFALTDFGENLFENSNIKFIVDKKVDDARFLLPNYWNRQLLLLFKEAMTNAYKHSQANQLNLVFKIQEKFLIIECNDNGIGFTKEKLKRQNGLLNLEKRVNKLKSKIIINSESGTSVMFFGELNFTHFG